MMPKNKNRNIILVWVPINLMKNV